MMDDNELNIMDDNNIEEFDTGGNENDLDNHGDPESIYRI